MKNYMVTYTDDNGVTKDTVLVNAKSYTDAYMQIVYKISKKSMIIDLFEIV